MKRWLTEDRLPVLITAVVTVAMFVAAGLQYDNFMTLRVLLNMFTDNGFLGVVAVGLTFVILTGGIDLSVGAMVGCSSIIVASLLQRDWPALGAVGIALLFGCTIGALQGWLIARFRLQPFLVTLAGLFFCRGLALRISQESIAIMNPTFRHWSETSARLPANASLTLSAILLLFVVIVGWYVSRYTRFGRTVYAIGGNQASAELMGLPVRRTLIGTYLLCGALAAFGGVMFSLFTRSGNAVSGTGLELDAIAAVVIGGTLLRGGYGSIPGTLLGVLVLAIVQTAITFDGTLSSWWTKIVIGVLLLAFLLAQRAIDAAARRRHGLASDG
jgi:galactofuranose transport system permease protein